MNFCVYVPIPRNELLSFNSDPRRDQFSVDKFHEKRVQYHFYIKNHVLHKTKYKSV